MPAGRVCGGDAGQCDGADGGAEPMQAVVPVMRAQGGGSTVNVSSATTRMVLPGVGPYAASKAALNMLSAVARREVADAGIVVSTVCPFVTATEFHDTLRAGQKVAGVADGPAVHSAEYVADTILELIRSGIEEADLMPPTMGEGAAGRPGRQAGSTPVPDVRPCADRPDR